MTEQRMKELIDLGNTRLEAIEIMLKEMKATKSAKAAVNPKTVWVLLGNYRCPICQQYSGSNLHGSGWAQNMTLKVTCDTHGVFIKVPLGYWKRMS